MPLLDHFHPPLSERRHWEAFHARWASAIADALNEHGLPEHLFAEPTVTVGGQAQVDVGTFDEGMGGSTAILARPAVTPAPTWVAPAVFSDAFTVQVISTEGGPRLVAAIELVSPGNKDRPQTRRAFAIKCGNYLHQAIPFIMIDVVTSRSANLHNELMDLLEAGDRHLPEASLYAAAYRPVQRARAEIDIWPARFQVGESLPTLPLFVGPDLPVPVDFDAAYQETCQRLRLPA